MARRTDARRKIDFVDGHIAALMKKRRIGDLFSFDKKHVSRIPTVRRQEP